LIAYSRAPRRRQAIIPGTALAAFCLLAGLLVISVKESTPRYSMSGSEPTSIRQVNITDFIDNTANYKGKTITLELCVHINGDYSLRNYVGRVVKFSAFGPKSERLDIAIMIPNGLSVPNARFGERVKVTFLCANGNLQGGNEAQSIERP
jgi:hypothetical protein